MSDKNIIGYVWYSQKQHYKTIRYRTFSAGPDHREPPDVIEVMNKDTMQQFLSEDDMPQDIYTVEDENAHKKNPKHVFSFGFTVISEECAQVLRRFDLGQGALVPVRLWRQDRTTRIPGEFFYLTHGNRKAGFLHEHSPKAREWPGGGSSVWSPRPNPVDDQMFYSREALEGVDLWCDDLTYRGVMVSDRLAQALNEAGVAKDWLLLRCPVIEI